MDILNSIEKDIFELIIKNVKYWFFFVKKAQGLIRIRGKVRLAYLGENSQQGF